MHLNVACGLLGKSLSEIPPVAELTSVRANRNVQYGPMPRHPQAQSFGRAHTGEATAHSRRGLFLRRKHRQRIPALSHSCDDSGACRRPQRHLGMSTSKELERRDHCAE